MIDTDQSTKTKSLYVPEPGCLKDKVILVTGASKGIGRAVAKSLAAFGATVILMGRSIKALETIYDEIEAHQYPQPAIYPLNLATANAEHYEDIRRHIDQHFGRLDGLVLNAGILGTFTPLTHYNIETWYEVMQVNLNSTFLLTRACMPLLKKSPDASILFTTQAPAEKAKAYWGAYAVANAGAHTLMHVLADECENITNIRVNSIFPDNVQTQWQTKAYPGKDLTHLLPPEDVVPAYLFLMSPESKHINGQLFYASHDFCNNAVT